MKTRYKPITPDSTAFALNIKNFGYLPGDVQSKWMSDFLGSDRQYVPLPKRLIIELLNTCNFDCPMCRVGRYGVDLSRKLPFEDFCQVLDQLQGSIQEVRLNGLGESTLLPDLGKYVDELVSRKIKIELISNGSGRPEDYEHIFHNGGIIIISWDAACKATYEVLRRPAKWDDSVQSLTRLASMANEQGRSDQLFLMFTLQKKNTQELPQLVMKCHEWGIRNLMVNVVKQPNDRLKDDADVIRKAFSESAILASKYHISLMLPDQVNGIQIHAGCTLTTSSHGCMMPREEAVLRWNGDVQACNMFNPYIYGNIKLATFQDIWNNAFAQTFRKNLNEDTKHPYCRDCVYMRDAYAKRST